MKRQGDVKERLPGMNPSEPVQYSISAVEFRFLASEDIKALSVKRITNPTTFDTLLHPVPGGLYDSALGSFQDQPCSTCELTERDGCPGHSGHIELPVPVYHVSFLDQLLRLLRGKCVYCHCFKMSRTQINQYICKLQLLRCGLVQQAESMDEHIDFTGGSKTKDIAEDSDEEKGGDESNIIAQRNAYVKKMIKLAGISSKSSHKPRGKTQAMTEARAAVIKEMFTAMNGNPKCRNCGGVNPTYRKERAIKIFQKRLNKKDEQAMAAAEKVIVNPLKILSERQRRANKQPIRAAAFLAGADRDSVSQDEEEDEDEDAEMLDAQDADGSLVAGQASERADKSTADAEHDGSFRGYMTSAEVKAAMTLLFAQEEKVLRLVYSPHSRSKAHATISADMFFIQNLLIPSNQSRIPTAGEDSLMEPPKNALYKAILTASNTLREIQEEMAGKEPEFGRKRDFRDLQTAWLALQNAVNGLIDSDASPNLSGNADTIEGIKQRLEKKEGLFRKNMMGKRVNFAARSVISPDPNIGTNEIGVPLVFAQKLTYPEPVTYHNYHALREAVINGPTKWPGATMIEDENGEVIKLKDYNSAERLGLANQLLSAEDSGASRGFRGKKVHRHLTNGDIVIMNRQPTLHKPSMMCHRARVLPGERTIRMHYANCKTYNADFDGDEMNMHFPQNEVARAEAVTIADTDHQYLSGTAGEPLRGLIQDHISLGVWLTNRDTFFTREDFQQLLYSGLRPEDFQTTTSSIITPPPAVLKPRVLWTGKQVITAVLENIKPLGYPGLTFTSKSSTDGKLWGPGSEEGVVLVKDNDWLCGILDKKQIGSAEGGLINAVYEAYGHAAAGRILTTLGRVLTKMLHMRAFSCGVEDLILTREGDEARLKKLKDAEKAGFEVAAKYVTLDAKKVHPTHPELRKRLEKVLRDDSKQHGLDMLTNTAVQKISSAVTEICLPDTLIKPFPKNQMQTMTRTGAKGSLVNANQISCNLGQQVLEGRRVPVMVSGKTLPCFKPFETSVRAGGYVVNRFLTGIRPQEYYFHTMAGREGLIDTAVKTSRSGYLQRCIVKGLEGLRVGYDTSVRDSDGSMIQFLYGEDGLDITKAKYLNDFKFQAENIESLYKTLDLTEAYPRVQSDEATNYTKTAYKKVKKAKNDAIVDPALALFTPSRHCGSVSERFFAAKKEYCDNNPDNLIKPKKGGEGLKRKNFETTMDMKYLRSLIEPGEAVGVVAGQSIGEPSTQMTLNTFHLAGHAAKNVTLGIPRLREIVMTASAKISTPAMTLYPVEGLPESHIETFAKSISRLPLTAVLDKITVTETLGDGMVLDNAKTYKIRLDFYPSDEYCKEYAIKTEDVVFALETKFTKRLQKILKAEIKRAKAGSSERVHARDDAEAEEFAAGNQPNGTAGDKSAEEEEYQAQGKEVDPWGNDSEDEGEDAPDDDDDAEVVKSRQRRKDDVEYDGPDEEEESEASDAEEDNDKNDKNDENDENDEEDEDDIIADRNERITQMEQAMLELDTGARKARVMKECSDVVDFVFDDIHGNWAEVTFEYPTSTPKVLMLHLAESAAQFTTIQVIPGIEACMVSTEKVKDPNNKQSEAKIPVIVTEGANLTAMQEFAHIIDTNRIMTNDIAAMLRLYGVEACRSSIVREMHAVFAGHGIDVDHRHLNLIADTMTRHGGFTPFNRYGLKTSVSPFMKMSFETTVNFIRDAVLERDVDELKNPSSRIVVGKLGSVGTGAFDVVVPFTVPKREISVP